MGIRTRPYSRPVVHDNTSRLSARLHRGIGACTTRIIRLPELVESPPVEIVLASHGRRARRPPSCAARCRSVFARTPTHTGRHGVRADHRSRPPLPGTARRRTYTLPVYPSAKDCAWPWAPRARYTQHVCSRHSTQSAASIHLFRLSHEHPHRPTRNARALRTALALLTCGGGRCDVRVPRPIASCRPRHHYNIHTRTRSIPRRRRLSYRPGALPCPPSWREGLGTTTWSLLRVRRRARQTLRARLARRARVEWRSRASEST